MEKITSQNNSQVKYLMRLISQASFRRREESFVLEGKNLIYDSPKNLIKKIFVSQSYYNSNIEDLKAFECGLYVVADDIISRISDTKNTQGIFAIARMNNYAISEICADAQRVLVIDRVMDPGNLGTILRTAEAFGVDGILIGKGSVDIYNPKAVRSSMSSLLRLKFAFYEDEGVVCDLLVENKIGIVVSALSAADCCTTVSYPNRVALVIGNEAKGVSDTFIERANLKVYIDMDGEIESLNVAVASAILLYEIRRQ